MTPTSTKMRNPLLSSPSPRLAYPRVPYQPGIGRSAPELLNRSENLVRIAVASVTTARACMHVSSSVKLHGED